VYERRSSHCAISPGVSVAKKKRRCENVLCTTERLQSDAETESMIAA
tara:strand:- start:546 stop:686 length:141 start_codon:yes stop_codon:yes gene_type:complete